jgi:DNA mismatch repair protein MutS2
LVNARQPLDALEAVEEKAAELSVDHQEPIERLPLDDEDILLDRPIRLGDRVRLRSLNTRGLVTSLGKDELEIQVGNLRVRTRYSEVEAIESGMKTEPEIALKSKPPSSETGSGLNAPSPGIELDLRGRRADDALEQLERYLDAAYLAGLPFVRIIHGKGTGKLRQAVRETLRTQPHIKSFEPGRDNEGGDGVTVAKLKNS